VHAVNNAGLSVWFSTTKFVACLRHGTSAYIGLFPAYNAAEVPMKRLAIAALVPIFAGFLGAQTETKTVTTTYDGTLVDEGCRTKNTTTRESTTDAAGATRIETTRTQSTECPVTMTTTAFSLLTPEGKYITFDPESNTKIVTIVKSNKDWDRLINEHNPVQVHVIGRPNGKVVYIEEIR
jgi:hypothetical protein